MNSLNQPSPVGRGRREAPGEGVWCLFVARSRLTVNAYPLTQTLSPLGEGFLLRVFGGHSAYLSAYARKQGSGEHQGYRIPASVGISALCMCGLRPSAQPFAGRRFQRRQGFVRGAEMVEIARADGFDGQDDQHV